MDKTPQGTALLRIPEVAAELRVTRSTVYAYISQGLIRTVHIGPRRLTRVERTELDAYIQRSRSAA